MSDNLYLTPEELKERYKEQVTIRTFANWRSQGKGPPFTKIGGGVLYPMDQLQIWEKRNTLNSVVERFARTKR